MQIFVINYGVEIVQHRRGESEVLDSSAMLVESLGCPRYNSAGSVRTSHKSTDGTIIS